MPFFYWICMNCIKTSILINKSPVKLWVLNYLFIKWCFLWKPWEDKWIQQRWRNVHVCLLPENKLIYLYSTFKQPMDYDLFGIQYCSVYDSLSCLDDGVCVCVCVCVCAYVHTRVPLLPFELEENNLWMHRKILVAVGFVL